MEIQINKHIAIDEHSPLVNECFFEDPITYQELNPCGSHCGGFHPRASIYVVNAEEFCVRGQYRTAGIHVSGMEFHKHFSTKEEAFDFAASALGVSEIEENEEEDGGNGK